MNNPLNPLDWIKHAQDWFSRTERSSGFRPYLIFYIIQIMFITILLTFFSNSLVTTAFAVPSLYLTTSGFVLLYVVKSFQDPNFCRSEKHIENVKKIEMMEQKGDKVPQVIDTYNLVVSEPHQQSLLTDDSTRGEK